VGKLSEDVELAYWLAAKKKKTAELINFAPQKKQFLLVGCDGRSDKSHNHAISRQLV
jgi:hypothetical protein